MLAALALRLRAHLQASEYATAPSRWKCSLSFENLADSSRAGARKRFKGEFVGEASSGCVNRFGRSRYATCNRGLHTASAEMVSLRLAWRSVGIGYLTSKTMIFASAFVSPGDAARNRRCILGNSKPVFAPEAVGIRSASFR